MPSRGVGTGPCSADLNLTDSGQHRQACFPVTQQKAEAAHKTKVKEAEGVRVPPAILQKNLISKKTA